MAQAGESRSKPFDMAYHGHITPLKALIAQDKNLKTALDDVIKKKFLTNT